MFSRQRFSGKDRFFILAVIWTAGVSLPCARRAVAASAREIDRNVNGGRGDVDHAPTYDTT